MEVAMVEFKVGDTVYTRTDTNATWIVTHVGKEVVEIARFKGTKRRSYTVYPYEIIKRED